MQKKKEAAQKAYDLMKAIKRDGDGNPLTLEGVIRSVILKNPDSIQYRDDALGLIYCVLGSGIRWINGRLGDCTPNNYMNMPPDVGGQGCWSRDFGMSETFSSMFNSKDKGMVKIAEDIEKSLREDHERELEKAIKTVDEVDVRCQLYRPTESWYPVSWFRCNLAAPHDAQKDFLLGAIETATLICKMNPQPGTERWVVHQQTKQFAEEILVVLSARITPTDGEAASHRVE